MKINRVPPKSKKNLTGCCPEFNPAGWDGSTFVFRGKKFVRFTTRSFFYMPLDMNKQIVRVMQMIECSCAGNDEEQLMLSRDLSPWKSEHYVAVTKEVKGMENIKLTGTFLAKVFEGPYREMPKWMKTMAEYVRSKKQNIRKLYFNYTMCPACSKFYGKNYVVGFAQV